MSFSGTRKIAVLSDRTLWLAGATGLVAAVTASPGLGIGGAIFAILLLGAAVGVYSNETGKLLIWLGALITTLLGIVLFGGAIVETLRIGESLPLLFSPAVFSLILIVVCDASLIVDTLRNRRMREVASTDFPNLGDWMGWALAAGLTYWLGWGSVANMGAYHRLGRKQELWTAAALAVIALFFAIAVTANAYMRWRAGRVPPIQKGAGGA